MQNLHQLLLQAITSSGDDYYFSNQENRKQPKLTTCILKDKQSVCIIEIGSGTGLFITLLLPILQQIAQQSNVRINFKCLEPVTSMRELHTKQLGV